MKHFIHHSGLQLITHKTNQYEAHMQVSQPLYSAQNTKNQTYGSMHVSYGIKSWTWGLNILRPMQFPSDFGINVKKNIIQVTHPNIAAAIVYCILFRWHAVKWSKKSEIMCRVDLTC
jgi:hypothetical protein